MGKIGGVVILILGAGILMFGAVGSAVVMLIHQAIIVGIAARA